MKKLLAVWCAFQAGLHKAGWFGIVKALGEFDHSEFRQNLPPEQAEEVRARIVQAKDEEAENFHLHWERRRRLLFR